ncbi:recombinase family protein [Paenibacillus timonensis]|uniref:recombinase family protein n=1 Tax=Paenibacillus timonensis TaxID=225915 RepID=UPI0022E02760|nr:recombinase family protein [Paenibacillus timonensis]
MKYYVYARSAKQSPEAIIAQVKKCMQYADEKGLLIEEVFIDDGFSGLTNDRPGYNNLLNTVKVEDTVIVASAEALSRNFDQVSMIDFLYKLVLLDKITS